MRLCKQRIGEKGGVRRYVHAPRGIKGWDFTSGAAHAKVNAASLVDRCVLERMLANPTSEILAVPSRVSNTGVKPRRGFSRKKSSCTSRQSSIQENYIVF
jgi:hypothetical protein